MCVWFFFTKSVRFHYEKSSYWLETEGSTNIRPSLCRDSTRKAAARADTGQKTHHINPFSVICNTHDYRKKGWPVVACRHEKKSVTQLWETRKFRTYLRVFSGSSNFSIAYVQKCIQMSTEYVTAFTARSYTSTIFSGVPRRASWSAYFFQ